MTTPEPPVTRRRSRRSAATTGRRSRLSAVGGVLGELMLTAGVFIFLFIGWQLWLNDIIVGSEQNSDALAFSQELGGGTPPRAQGGEEPEPVDYGEPVVGAEVPERTRFANIYIPRFGADYVRTVAEGVDTRNVLRTGVGHYPGTQLPGEVGNFAVAAHRTTWGAPFGKIADLQVGDAIYVQTADGWYTYTFRSMEYVLPTGIEVLEPVPQQPDAEATGRVMTMTSCNPMFSAAERIIAYSVFDSWQPASAGPPSAIATLAQSGV